MQSKHKQTNVNIADETLTYYSFLSIGITILNQRIIWKDDIEFVTESHVFWDTLYEQNVFLLKTNGDFI